MHKNKINTAGKSQVIAKPQTEKKQTSIPKSSSKEIKSDNRTFSSIHQNWLTPFEV